MQVPGVQVFDREWPVRDDYGYSEVHVAVNKDGDEWWFRSCYGGTLGGSNNGEDCAKLLGPPDLERGQKADVADSLDGGWVPNPSDDGYQNELAEELFGVSLDLSTYKHNCY